LVKIGILKGKGFKPPGGAFPYKTLLSFTFRGEKCAEDKVNRTVNSTFSNSRHAPRTSRERNRMIFSKGEQTIIRFSAMFPRNKGEI